MTPLKLPVKTKTQQLVPSAAVKSAYDLKLTGEAVGRLKEIEELRAYAAEQAELASKITIKDDESNARAAEVVVNLTKARKALEELQKYYSSPLEKAKKGVIAVFKKLGENALGQEERLRREAEQHWWKKENERRAAEAKALADQQAAQTRARGLGRAAPAPVAPPAAPEAPRSVQTENGTLGIKLVWGFDVTDQALVPRQYLKVDEAAIRAAVGAGVREIPGVLISERPESAVR